MLTECIGNHSSTQGPVRIDNLVQNSTTARFFHVKAKVLLLFPPLILLELLANLQNIWNSNYFWIYIALMHR